MQTTKSIQQANAKELALGHIGGYGSSWHDKYADSAYIFVGNLPFELTEGDLLVVFEQYGTIVDVNLVRDQETGKSKGFAFIGYEDQRSTILAVDNFNGANLLGRTLRVDHVAHYKRKQEENVSEEDETLLHSKQMKEEERKMVQQRVEREVSRYIESENPTSKSGDDLRQERVLARLQARRLERLKSEQEAKQTK
eukprot:jgi/Galph1/2210/GphlegSOOS_G891.1